VPGEWRVCDPSFRYPLTSLATRYILGGSIKSIFISSFRMADPIEARLKRIEGQISGLRKMYKEGRDCLEIAQQISAARSALASVGREIVSGEAIRCAGSASKQKDFSRMIEELFVMK
jgi:CsoR family transcriptional regulator, copper-sensing transcriptional repressor